MTNREYINQLNTYIKSSFNKEKSEKGFVDNNFFKSEDLKSRVKKTLTMMMDSEMFPRINDEKFNEFYATAIKESKHKNQSGMTPSVSLESEESKKNLWLTTEKQDKLGWNSDELNTYRMRYMKYLNDIGRSEDYIKETKRSSLAIVKKFGNPNAEHPFYTRGLVVGSVQSGKTANFNAVINSSIDMGYGLIIVLSGIMEDLRKQTQKRIEKEVEGKYINGSFIGVGEVASFGIVGDYKDVHQIILPTSIETDFKKNMKEADFSLNNKNILVCKKNTSVLKNLLLWLDEYLNENKDKIKIPFLIIDDEADNASLNNLGSKGKAYASTINGHIRALLALFEKKTYLGYTATPFGNILQDRNEKSDEKWTFEYKGERKSFDQEASLFPHDFIELLFPPSNYIGAKHFFETRLDEVKKIEPLVLAVNDYVDIFPFRVFEDTLQPTSLTGKGTRATKAEDPFPPENLLPNSLKDAIKCFVLSIAIRTSREKEMYQSKLFQPHNTMLVHISRFKVWQTKTAKSIQKYVEELTSAVNNDSPNSKKGIYAEFELTWNRHYAYIMENINNYLPEDYNDDYLTSLTFMDIRGLLIKAISDIEVKAINSDTKESLIYPDGKDNGKKYIAIGGNRLSRGFTLEGLTINYFIRNTNFADTLLQMGRWFGYRPGYVDCCKVFATREGLEKFDQTTRTIEDLEQKFIEMNREGKRPDEYSLKVLMHPGVLKITRPSILKNTQKVKWSYSDTLIQTTKFHIEDAKIKKAWSSFTSHILTLKDKFEIKKDTHNNPDYIEYQIESIDELFAFFKLDNTFYDSSSKETNNYFSSLEEYIRLCNKQNKLRKWSIAIKVSGRGSKLLSEESNFPIDIHKAVRSGFKPDSRWSNELIQHKMFAAGGSSSNILGGGKDMQIRLDTKEIETATKEFKEQLFKDLKKKYSNLSDREIQKKVDNTSPSEKVFRRKMSEDEGILLIYLMDLEEIFKYKKEEVAELNELKNMVDTSIPLIGYAIGIPKIDESIGGEYLESIYHIEDESGEDDEVDSFEDVIEDAE